MLRSVPLVNFAKRCAGLTVLVFIICAPASSQTALEPDGYTGWHLSIPADTKVRIRSEFGIFFVPIGYLNARLFFQENRLGRLKGDTKPRPHANQEQTWKSFAFNFWVPDGGMVWHSEPQVRANRPIEPGHVSRSRENFVVKMHSMNSVRDRISRKPDMSALPEKLDVVLPAEPKFVSSVAYKGVTRDGKADSFLRTYVECRGGFLLCEGWFVIDRRQMVLWVFVPRDAADLMLDAAKTAARLLDSWEESAPR